jgi:hypothetical protein
VVSAGQWNEPIPGSRNFGQLRRNTDRFIAQRLGQMGLAIAMIIIVELIKRAKTMEQVDTSLRTQKIGP